MHRRSLEYSPLGLVRGCGVYETEARNKRAHLIHIPDSISCPKRNLKGCKSNMGVDTTVRSIVDVAKYSSPLFGIFLLLYGVELNQVTCLAPLIGCDQKVPWTCRPFSRPPILWPYVSRIPMILLAISLWALPNPNSSQRQLKNIRLAVLSCLTFLLGFWIARILALTGIIALPLGLGTVGVQADGITAGLLIASGFGIVGLKVLNRRLRPESTKPPQA